MKVLIASLVLGVCVAVSGFAQDSNKPRYQTLSDSMGGTVQSGTTKLGEFDNRIGYNGNAKVYASYKQKYDSLSRALQDSEQRLSRLIESNTYANDVKQERDRYDSLVKQINSVKSEYDDWLKSVQ